MDFIDFFGLHENSSVRCIWTTFVRRIHIVTLLLLSDKVGLASNSMNENEYKFEAMLLSRYEENFSTYTMKKFMEEYLTPLDRAPFDEKEGIETLQRSFSIMSVKVLLVSLLNAFRDLTLMGVQAFDFNHLSNVLVSRDHRLCRLIDIDGDSKGSIQLDDTAEYIQGQPSASSFVSTSSPSGLSPASSKRKISIHKPSLEIDLNTVLPTLVEQMILGKGRGRSFVANKRSEIYRAKPEKARDLIMEVLRENFYPDISNFSEDEIFKAGKNYSVHQSDFVVLCHHQNIPHLLETDRRCSRR